MDVCNIFTNILHGQGWKQEKIAYCVNPDLSGVGWVNGEEESYSTKVEYKLTDERIQSIGKWLSICVLYTTRSRNRRRWIFGSKTSHILDYKKQKTKKYI